MATKTKSQKKHPKQEIPLTLFCEIVEIYHKKNKSVAKIKINPDYLEIILDQEKDFHLGDELLIDGKIRIESVVQNTSEVI